ncbi:MAG: chromosome segregation protein SMC [Sinobacteraceae bacterium]|nr:chromosome segregation protein SMC [Nevskiaceae bacterium]
MRLTKIKLAGFKSFVDPTTVTFPSNLTGVVGPNGCGKSNVIDAVRWVMGELSAKHLRGDSMADVIFNGSSARKPVGKASVELVFDNSDGKIGGTYAAYAEVSLKREVSRDGSSAYYINGAKCRRKDITQLFLGTGLGSRSYAIIEQGMISRVIEAKSDDMRAFLEEAAGISRYKERRKETESRIADTRENLERLQDVRDEIDKQIRHLQRQAATARRYQALKEQERKITAELLALRLRELDSGTEVHDSAVREKDLVMQAALADLRGAEAAIDKQRGFQAEQSEQVSQIQARYFAVGADISRTEQQIQHTRETRDRQREDLTKSRATLADLALHIERDEQELVAIRDELARIAPDLETARLAEQQCQERLEETERTLAAWQQGWESFNRDLGGAHQTVQVERARIEQLENQQRRLRSQADRIAVERDQLIAQEASNALAELAGRESEARSVADELSQALAAALSEVQGLRSAQISLEQALESARGERERARAEVMSIEALQRAALGQADARANNWLRDSGLADRPRLAEALQVEAGWEKAVETVLGDYLEAVCVDGFDALTDALGQLGETQLSIFETGAAGFAPTGEAAGRLAACVQGPAAVLDFLQNVRTAQSLAEAMAARRSLQAGESIITRSGEWVGRGWLRVARGADPHAGVLEREQRLKSLRGTFAAADARVKDCEAQQQELRSRLAGAESARDVSQSRIQQASRAHADLLGRLEASRARAQEANVRRARLEDEFADIAREIDSTEQTLGKARGELDRGLLALDALDSRRPEIEAQREDHREALAAARAASQTAQLAARDLLVRIEGRRSTESSMDVGLRRMVEQRGQLLARVEELERALADGDAPIVELQGLLDGFLARRLEVEADLTQARCVLEEADTELRTLDEKRHSAERRVNEAREGMESARLAAQESRVRREALAEQFAETRFELADILEGLAAEAEVPAWEATLQEVRADVEKLGQVNLAAIDELKENTERKEYLDRQFADLTSALDTLEQAMRRIEKETRSRFQDTFDRVNAGLKEKFPRLFGGGHAYLELIGDDALSAGVAVMARPPGKRNVTISQLSGGEKALTAVALVFSIFDLNPAPFCLLDEVDAPLDENNVGRFCDIVREMAQQVQFIFITHNKSTMELASQLLGVTMNEPGVSRLVAVDVDEALRLAAS